MWTKLFDDTITINVQTKILPSKGHLVYEYNPFRNYRLSSSMYEYNNGLYSIGDLFEQFGIGIRCTAGRRKVGNTYSYLIKTEDGTIDSTEYPEITNDITEWIPDIYKKGKTIDRQNFEKALDEAKLVDAWTGVNETSSPVLREKGELVDFITDELNISLEHPVQLIPQYSYDGSVNLIINDGVNIPRLINSRFSATGKNTYEVIDRKGNNDSNIYDQGEQFDSDTSLYKRVSKIPKIKFNGVTSGGNLKVGNYHFYFKLSDADGNETDFVGESGLVSIFIGQGSYYSVHTGQRNENSFKQISFTFENLDPAYSYMYVYYSRSSAENESNSVVEYIKITQKYLLFNSDRCVVNITGYEDTETVTLQDVNLLYNIVDSAKTQAVCQNMLFMANVHRPNLPYEELSDLSLRFLPYLKEENYDVSIDEHYNIHTYEQGYIDPLFIYNKTGYWGEELYRIGIVYILPNGQLSPVFNIRGANKITTYKNDGYTNFSIFDSEGKRTYIDFNEQTGYVIDSNSTFTLENVKGVISLNPTLDTNTIYSLDVRVDDETIQELKKYVKGYFFVRQKRIPTILTQAITIGIDKESKTPTLPIAGGIIQQYQELFNNTHIETDDLSDVNYISEGFLSRFTFKIDKQKTESWKTALKITAIAVAVVAAVAATVFTCGAAGVALGAVGASVAGAAGAAAAAGTAGAVAGGVTLGAIVGTTGAAVISTTAIVGGATVLGSALVVGADAAINKINQIRNKVTLNGRNTVIPKGYEMVEIEQSRTLTDNFEQRFILKDYSKNDVLAMICPDYSINQPYFNQIFTGNKHLIKSTMSQNINRSGELSSSYFNSNYRHFYVPSYYDSTDIYQAECNIITIPEGVKAVGLGESIFRSRAGNAEEAWTYESIGQSYKDETMYTDGDKKKKDDSKNDKVSLKKINSDIVRGIYCPYLAFENINSNIGPAETVNIYIPEYSPNKINDYFQIRMSDNSSYYAIGDRIDIQDSDSYLVKNTSALLNNTDRSQGYQFNLYRGDCYLCQFTQRINRNFNDPSAPYNDTIVDLNSWKDNYDPLNTESYADINLGDVNAVPLGMWLTFKVRSSNNLNIRTLDGSNIDESIACGHKRGYFPYYPMSTDGSYKIPESQVYNKGFTKSVSERFNVPVPDVPHIKNWFGTRIMYSDVHINDAYKNGFRVFQSGNYRDYTRSYGEIVKLISLEDSLLCIFEHGIARIPVNERALAGSGSGGNVYVNTSNVLPENPLIVSDMIGSQWADSIIKVPGNNGNSIQYVYGVDTVAKKIWRTDGQRLECISDLKVQEFLNNNITLGERELTPKIGIRNVKTVYNAFKRDVLFTFYDNTYGFEEKVWNLCWNEILEMFITFYSWVPSYMENINNIPFSFNRDTSKWIAKLGTSHTSNSFADGVTLSNNIFNNSITQKTINDDDVTYDSCVDDYKFYFTYINQEGQEVTRQYEVAEGSRDRLIGVLSLSNRTLPDTQLFYQIQYSLERDHYKNHELFEIVELNIKGQQNPGILLPSSEDSSKQALFAGKTVKIYGLKLKESVNIQDLLSEIYYRNKANKAHADTDSNKIDTTLFKLKWIKIDNTTIKNKYVLDNFKNIYGENQYIGYQNQDGSINKIGTIKEALQFQLDDAPGAIPDANKIEWLDERSHIFGQHIYDCFLIKEFEYLDKPIFKNRQGKRLMLPKELQLNPDKIVRLLNIKASIQIIDDSTDDQSLSDSYYNMKAGFEPGTSLIDAGYYESVVAVIPKWNMQFLSADFWKHGQAGIIDITDKIYPTYWYGKQHPFEFECVVVDDPQVHKIFTNLELISNKAKPESFHYEVVGDAYDFAEDKPTMYFRQEALKALYQYNGYDIEYNRNFLDIEPKQHNKSADLPKYYSRWDTINEIYDSYKRFSAPLGFNYDHLAGAEIVYYPTRNEFRVWNHAQAIDIDSLSSELATSVIKANCRYLEDKWLISINPIIVTYKNELGSNENDLFVEYKNQGSGKFVKNAYGVYKYSTWVKGRNNSLLPPISIQGTKLEEAVGNNKIQFPGDDIEHPEYGKENALYGLYDLNCWNKGDWRPIDPTNGNKDRRETDVRGKFMKVRIRYSGEELAIIDFLNTIYQISFA